MLVLPFLSLVWSSLSSHCYTSSELELGRGGEGKGGRDSTAGLSIYLIDLVITIFTLLSAKWLGGEFTSLSSWPSTGQDLLHPKPCIKYSVISIPHLYVHLTCKFFLDA